MKLSSDQVKKVAKLASLDLTKEELGKYSKQLSKILDYIDQLNRADTSKVETTFNVLDQKDVMAKDQLGECLTQDEALSNALQKQDGFFVTKGVFSDE